MQRTFSNIVIVVVAMACLAIASGALFRHGERFQDLTAIAIYVLAPLTLAAALVACFWLSSELRFSVALCLVGAASVIYGFDLYLRLSAETRESMRAAAAPHWGYPADRRTVLEVIQERERSREVIWPLFLYQEALITTGDGKVRSTLSANGRELVPFAGISKVPTISDSEFGYWVEYVSDRYGFRNPDKVWDKPADIVLLGDSFTFGSSVPLETHFSGILGERYNVVNLGYPAAGPFGYYATLIEYGSWLKPKHVLLFFTEANDMKNIGDDAKHPMLLDYLRKGFRQGLRDLQPQIDDAAKSVITELRRQEEQRIKIARFEIADALLLRKLRHHLGIAAFTDRWRRPPPIQYPDLLVELLAKTRDEVATWGGKLHVVYLPAWNRGRDERGVLMHYEETRRLVQSTSERLDILFLDSTPAFEAHSTPERLSAYPGRRGGHYSPIGYRLVGDLLVQYLAKQAN